MNRSWIRRLASFADWLHIKALCIHRRRFKLPSSRRLGRQTSSWATYPRLTWRGGLKSSLRRIPFARVSQGMKVLAAAKRSVPPRRSWRLAVSGAGRWAATFVAGDIADVQPYVPQMSQDRWNVRFARTLPVGSPFAPREFIAGKDAATLARDLLALTQEEFSAAFRDSPMKRAKLRGLTRNAAVVLGNVGTPADASGPAPYDAVAVAAADASLDARVPHGSHRTAGTPRAD